jgi:GTP-binding protein
MKIKTAEYIGSFANISQLPKANYPEVAFAGRSNVGKSSLINKLLNRKNLARTSSTPGKTRLLNFYFINEDFYFVDLPGFGYAKLSIQERDRWKQLIEGYIQNREQLRGIIQLFDIRHSPTELDLMMSEWAEFLRIPTLFVGTKVDKVKRSKRNKQLAIAQKKFNLPDKDFIILFSSKTGEGKDEVWHCIQKIMEM